MRCSYHPQQELLYGQCAVCSTYGNRRTATTKAFKTMFKWLMIAAVVAAACYGLYQLWLGLVALAAWWQTVPRWEVVFFGGVIGIFFLYLLSKNK